MSNPKKATKEQENQKSRSPSVDNTLNKSIDPKINDSLIKEESKIDETPKEQRKLEHLRKQNAETLNKYIEATGISMAFKIVFAEVIAKKLSPEEALPYTAERLREIGHELSRVQVMAKQKAQQEINKSNLDRSQLSPPKGKSDQSPAKLIKDVKEKDKKDVKDKNDVKDKKDPKEVKDKDGKEKKDTKDTKDVKDNKDAKDKPKPAAKDQRDVSMEKDKPEKTPPSSQQSQKPANKAPAPAKK